MGIVREAAVAGPFYPGDPPTLARQIGQLLGRALATSTTDFVPKAIIAPHAGYIYSGPIAASAYARLAPARGKMTRVVLLGPAHRVPVDGFALPGAKAFATPLGLVAVDADGVERVKHLPRVADQPAAHATEHALEVQLPFLQTLLGEFSLIPLVVGRAEPEEVAGLLDALWGGPETVIVVSSDLSHYLSYAEAREIDARTARSIVALESELEPEQACGATPVNGLLLTARRRGLQAQLLDLRNSGDTAGDPGRVVGYGAFAFA